MQDETEKSSRMNACSSKFPTCLRSLSKQHPTSTVYNITLKRYKRSRSSCHKVHSSSSSSSISSSFHSFFQASAFFLISPHATTFVCRNIDYSAFYTIYIFSYSTTVYIQDSKCNTLSQPPLLLPLVSSLPRPQRPFRLVVFAVLLQLERLPRLRWLSQPASVSFYHISYH
jgi:hypothetical protein